MAEATKRKYAVYRETHTDNGFGVMTSTKELVAHTVAVSERKAISNVMFRLRKHGHTAYHYEKGHVNETFTAEAV